MKKVFAAVGAALLIPAAMFAGDTCATATVISNASFPSVVPAEDLTTYTKDNPYDTTGSHLQDGWFVFTAPATALYSFNNTNTSFDNIITIVDATGGCGSLPGTTLFGPYDSGIADNGAAVLSTGQTVFVIQGVYAGSASVNCTMTVTQTLLPPSPGNDTCATAIPFSGAGNGNTTDTLSGFFPYVGNLGNTDSIGGPAINDLWFAYTADHSGLHRIYVSNGEGWLPNGNSNYTVSVYDNCTSASTDSADPLAYGNYSIPGTSTTVIPGPYGAALERAHPFFTSGNTYYINVEDIANSVAFTTQTIGLVVQPTTTNSAFYGDQLLSRNLLRSALLFLDGQVSGGTFYNDGGRELSEEFSWAGNDTTATLTFTFTGLSTTTAGSLFSRPNLARNVASPSGSLTPTGNVEGVVCLYTGSIDGETTPSLNTARTRFSFTLTPSAGIQPKSGFFYYAPYGSSTLLGGVFRATRSAVGAGAPADNFRTGTLGAPLTLTPLDDGLFWNNNSQPNGTMGDDTDPVGFNPFGVGTTYWAITVVAPNNQAGTIALGVYKHDYVAAGVEDWTALN